ncbi:MAG: Peptide methionine sulfoxide reductase MsrA [Flavobacteriaceae bacterium]|nr:MAG: Peptide methionine sulfoxide reductase MsrA [Flavobacteriaceae bacterium]
MFNIWYAPYIRYQQIMKHRFTLLILIFMAFTLQCQQNKGNLTQKTIEIPEGMEVAYFASGCFWCVEGVYEEVYGVNEVISGYAGGTVPNPSYYDHGNHAETVAVIYDASKVSYSVLLQVYFDITNPYTIGQAPDFGKSYRSIVFPKNKSQMEELNTYLASFDRHKIEILLAKSPPFTIAEEYHQDYVSRLLKGENVVNKSYGYNVSLPRRQEFINNTKVRLKD